MLIQTYLQLQIFKIVILYLLLDIVVLSQKRWKLEAGKWIWSLVAVFILSIPFGYADISLFNSLKYY